MAKDYLNTAIAVNILNFIYKNGPFEGERLDFTAVLNKMIQMDKQTTSNAFNGWNTKPVLDEMDILEKFANGTHEHFMSKPAKNAEAAEKKIIESSEKIDYHKGEEWPASFTFQEGTYGNPNQEEEKWQFSGGL